jgi:uncharacterized protein (UPF0332 family)
MIVPEDFLVLAEAWVTTGSEAEWRCAVSRAYYAAFHAARQLLRDLGFRVPRAGQAHAYTFMRLSNCGALVLQQAGADLDALHGERNRADYDIHQTLRHTDAIHLVQRARQIVVQLAAGLGEPTRTRIRDAMRDYERITLRNVTWQGP